MKQEIKNIKNSKETKEQLSQLVEEERQRKRITGREFMGDYDHDGFDDDHYDHDDHYQKISHWGQISLTYWEVTL